MKKENKLLHILGEVDEQFIMEAAPETKPRVRKKVQIIKYGSIVACLVCIVYGGIKSFSGRKPLSSSSGHTQTELPHLTIGEYFQDGMGFEGYFVNDISELVNKNPWSEDLHLKTLPVFQNCLTHDEHYILHGANIEEMKKYLLEIASRFGLEEEKLKIYNNDMYIKENASDNKQLKEEEIRSYGPTQIYVKDKEISICVDQDMTVTITFDPAISLPKEYRFSYDSSYEELEKVGDYIKETYDNVIQMEQPEVNITGGDYDIDKQQRYQLSFYNKSDDSIQNIIDYNFNQINFYCDYEDKLWMIRIFHKNLTKKIGDYPIITKESATKELISGNYFTTCPYSFTDETYIAKSELVYHTSEYESYFIPFYCFYVELPEEKMDNGLKTYGTYYVPAVEPSYISDLPVNKDAFDE